MIEPEQKEFEHRMNELYNALIRYADMVKELKEAYSPELNDALNLLELYNIVKQDLKPISNEYYNIKSEPYSDKINECYDNFNRYTINASMLVPPNSDELKKLEEAEIIELNSKFEKINNDKRFEELLLKMTRRI